MSDLSATRIGEQIGASGEEVNRLLIDQGFLDGKPGAWSLTSKGEEYGVHRDYDNGNNSGWYHEAHSFALFDSSIIDVLDASPEKLAEARADITADRQAQRAEREAAQDEYEANYQASQAAKEKEEQDELIGWLIACGVVALTATVIGAKKGIERYRRRKAEKAESDPAPPNGSEAK